MNSSRCGLGTMTSERSECCLHTTIVPRKVSLLDAAVLSVISEEECIFH